VKPDAIERHLSSARQWGKAKLCRLLAHLNEMPDREFDRLVFLVMGMMALVGSSYLGLRARVRHRLDRRRR
jgi:hypothetical protein